MRRSERLLRTVAVLAALAAPLCARAGADPSGYGPALILLGGVLIVALIGGGIFSYFMVKRIFRGQTKDKVNYVGIAIAFMMIFTVSVMVICTLGTFLVIVLFGQA